jgi:hypothetical protein
LSVAAHEIPVEACVAGIDFPVVASCCVASPANIGNLDFFRETRVQAVTCDAVNVRIDWMRISGRVNGQSWCRLSGCISRCEDNQSRQRNDKKCRSNRRMTHGTPPRTRSFRNYLSLMGKLSGCEDRVNGTQGQEKERLMEWLGIGRVKRGAGCLWGTPVLRASLRCLRKRPMIAV